MIIHAAVAVHNSTTTTAAAIAAATALNELLYKTAAASAATTAAATAAATATVRTVPTVRLHSASDLQFLNLAYCSTQCRCSACAVYWR
jgi:hypothetical protein